MKKLLPLLAFFLQADVEQNYSQVKAQEETKTLVETIYKHPKAKKVGDFMPSNLGEKVYHKIRHSSGSITGLIIKYDKDGDRIPEYIFMERFCDVPISALWDVPNESLYVDITRNNIIDIVEDLSTFEDERLEEIMPTRCEENEAKKSLRV